MTVEHGWNVSGRETVIQVLATRYIVGKLELHGTFTMKWEVTMTIEIRRPELEALILQRTEQGGFQDIEDALMQALQESPTVNEREGKSSSQRTGADLIKALQSSPYRELDIEPSRLRLQIPARDVKF